MKIGEYRRPDQPAADLVGLLLGGPKLDQQDAEVFAEVEAERRADHGRVADPELTGPFAE